MAKPTIFELEFLAIFNKAVDEFQSSTGYSLERQDAERFMLQIFSNMVYGWGDQWLEASLQNYLEYMTGPQLDAYGESHDTPRLVNTPSGAWIRINFIAALEAFYEIHEGTIFTGQNDNGTFTFRTLEIKIGETGDLYVDVWAEEFIDEISNSGELANNIEIGDIDTLVDEAGIYSIVDSVENIGESHGGHPSEEDDHYKARLVYVLGKPSTAGAFDAYVFHALSASVKVLDVGIKKPAWEVNIYTLPYDFESLVIGDASSQIDNLVLEDIVLDDVDPSGRLYWSLSGSPGRTFTLYKNQAKTIPVAEYVGVNGTGLVLAAKPGYSVNGTVDLTGSTDDTDIANVIETYAMPMCSINQLMNPSTGYPKVRPLNDIVNLFMCVKKTFSISTCDVTISEGNVETVKAQVTQVVNIFRDSLRTKAGKDAVRGELDKMIRNIGGIYDTDIQFSSLTFAKVIEADENEYLDCALPTINVTVHVP
jgi:phage-related baseplate assembly protein